MLPKDGAFYVMNAH